MYQIRMLVGISFIVQLIHPMPKTIVMIRHGEKEVLQNEYGKPMEHKEHGKIKPIYTDKLSTKGHERAAALVPFFTCDQAYTKFGTPAAIFAAAPSRNNPSVRSIDTIKPLADSLHIAINTDFTVEQYKKLAEHIKTNQRLDGKYIIICFEHHHLPLLAQALGIKAAPKKWPNVFDRIWITEFDQSGAVVNFEKSSQRLLFGDSK